MPRKKKVLIEVPVAEQSQMRLFVLERTEDVSGTSGIGPAVAEGCELSNGQVVLRWLSQLESITIFSNITVLERIHGHEGRTTIKWLDEK